MFLPVIAVIILLCYNYINSLYMKMYFQNIHVKMSEFSPASRFTKIEAKQLRIRVNYVYFS